MPDDRMGTFIYPAMTFSVCHFACVFRSTHPLPSALLLLPSTRLLMGLQLLYELIQDLLG